MRRKFGGMEQLRQQNKSVTDVAVIKLEQRVIFYLITKEHHWQKPTYQSIYVSLTRLKELCTELEINSLACPRMGCGLDGLQLETVRKMLRYIFKNSGVIVYVYMKDELTETEKMQLIKELHINPLGGHQGVSRTFNRLYAEHH
ncbi:PREDICTED: O-acetyl-ADP-ribose deacetylase 1-like [Diuraphis noxia]|uniref:O-acetyl-ADP-ribose deacetylase 1-like n=1 Tax=Diuraphis noxia TaxID=143948 RepID=UPI0007637883|nr:PREDICTED: O-acetyl-ADP-ribose deacetylase 1-like [Diuraphis noxia]